MTRNCNPIDIYFHMTNHYRKLRSVKSVVDTSPPTGYSEKLQSSRQSRPSSRVGTVKRVNSKSASSNDSSRVSYTGYIQNKPKHANARSQSLPARPPTRRKPTDMPNPVEQPMQEVIIVDFDVLGQMNTSLPAEKEKPTPAPRKQHSKKHDTSYKKSIAEHEYLQFSLRITEDIIRNDLYTNEEMRRVFNSHIEANRGRLDMDKMNKQIEHLCQELNIPHDGVSTTDVPTRSQIQTSHQNRKTCICGPMTNSPSTNLEECECGSVRCIPLSCTQHHKSTLENVAKSNMLAEVKSEQQKFENIPSSSEEEVIETNVFEKPENVSQASVELHNSIFDTDNSFNDLNNRSSPIRDYAGFVQLPSLSCVTEITEPSTSASTLKSTVAGSEVNTEIVSEYAQPEVVPEIQENLEIDHSHLNDRARKSISSKRSSITSKKSIGFGNNYVKVFTSEIHVDDLDLEDDDDSSVSRSYMEALELDKESDKRLVLLNERMDLDYGNENTVGITCCCHNPRQLFTGKDLESVEFCAVCVQSKEVQCSLVEVLSKESEEKVSVKQICIEPPKQFISENLSSLKDEQSVVENGVDKHKNPLVDSNFSKSVSDTKEITNPKAQASVQAVKSTLLIQSFSTISSNSPNNPSASLNQPTDQSQISGDISISKTEAVPVCDRSHSSQFEVLELLEPSSIKVRGSNNEEETLMLFPGCIYIPKIKLLNVVAPASLTPLATPSSFSKDADTSTDNAQLPLQQLNLEHAAGVGSIKLNQLDFQKELQKLSSESVLSAKSNQLYCNAHEESISSDTLASFSTKSNQPTAEMPKKSTTSGASTSKTLEQSDKAHLNAKTTNQTKEQHPSSNKLNLLESQIAKQNLSSHMLASIAENLNKISVGIAEKGEPLKTPAPVSNKTSELKSQMAQGNSSKHVKPLVAPGVLSTEGRNAELSSTLNQQSSKSEEQNSSLNMPATIVMGLDEPSVEIAEQNLDSNSGFTTSKGSSYVSSKKEEESSSFCSTEPINKCPISNPPEQDAKNVLDSYSKMHEAALHSIHYNSFTSSTAKASYIPQPNSLPSSQDFIENLNISGPPKILMQTNSTSTEGYRCRNPSSISGYETMDLSRPSRLLIEQLNDYDLTPQRDSNSIRSRDQIISQFPYSNRQQSGMGLRDGLLLGDEYEIKNDLEKTPSEFSRYDNCLPRAICKFYPNSSTQTQSSDWLIPTHSGRKQSEMDWNHFVKPSLLSLSGSDPSSTRLVRNDGFKRSFEVMFEKQEAERFHLQMEKALEEKLQHIESLNDARRKSFDSIMSDNTHMNFFMVGGEDKMSRDQLDTLNTATDTLMNVVEPKKGSRERGVAQTSSSRIFGDIGHSHPRDNKLSRENMLNVNVSESKPSVNKHKLTSSIASYGSAKSSKEKKINLNLSESMDKTPTQKVDSQKKRSLNLSESFDKTPTQKVDSQKKSSLNLSESFDKTATQKVGSPRVDRVNGNEEKQENEEELEMDVFESLDKAPSFIRRPSMMLTITQVTNNLKKLRRGNSIENRRSIMQPMESQESHDSLRRSSQGVPFIEVKSDSVTDLKAEGKGTKDERFTCCGLKKVKKKLRRDIVDVDESAHNIPNVSAIPDEELYMVDVRRPTNTGYGAERKSLRFDYSAMKDFNKSVDTELEESNSYEENLTASSEVLQIPRKPVISYRNTSYGAMTREKKSSPVAPYHSGRNDSTGTNDSVVDILSGPPSPSDESLLLETSENFRRKSVAQRYRDSTLSTDSSSDKE